jgi:hypothetical protein
MKARSGLHDRVELERIGGADVHQVQHLAQQCERHPSAKLPPGSEVISVIVTAICTT